MNIKLKTLAIGIIINILLGLILSYLLGGIGLTVALILAAVYVGFKVEKNYKVGALNGAILGIIFGICFGILLDNSLGLLYLRAIGLVIFLLLIPTVIFGIIGAISSIIGIYINEKHQRA
ncbi:hypothetical protein Metbo_1128 [Methanobacterium lacus]|uniref:DUF5518 domain-containing protein n=1 Tax=Methanobacterium lacus (strain AL-21) TaxID=877455 RepID=F0T5X9_METLA|nr:hypothetical protein Metbo_1128 [Methanobacterium lacus]